jgi:hypothetical protein
MGYEDCKVQLGFFQDTTPTATPNKEKCAAIPIYRVSLVRESQLHCYHKQIRSSADAVRSYIRTLPMSIESTLWC